MLTNKAETQEQETEEATRDGSIKEFRGLTTPQTAAQTTKDDAVRDGTPKEARGVDESQEANPDRSL